MLDLASTAADFSRLVRRRLEGGLPEDQAVARLRLASETWAEKVKQFEDAAILGKTREPSHAA